MCPQVVLMRRIGRYPRYDERIPRHMRGIPGSGLPESHMPAFEEYGSVECQGVRIDLSFYSPVRRSLFAHPGLDILHVKHSCRRFSSA